MIEIGLDEDDTDFNTIGKTGGSKDMQSHYHDIRSMNTEGNGVVASYTGTGDSELSLDNWRWVKNAKGYKDSAANLYTGTEGTGTSGNLQPYEVVGYMWIRRS